VQGASDGVRRMQWPLLLLASCLPAVLPAVDPRDFSAELSTQINGRRTVAQFRVSGPELDLIAVAAALVAIIDSHRNVDRKRRTSVRCGIMQGTTSVPLIASLTCRFETDQREYLLHGDLTSKPVKVNAWHGSFWDRQPFPFPLLYGERGTVSFCVANQWGCDGSVQLVPGSPVPARGVRS